MGIRRLPHTSCCFSNTNTAITRQLIRTARTLEAECWQVCGEAWVRGQRKMSQVLGAFGLLVFTMLRPVLVWHAFGNLGTVYFFSFPNFFFGTRPTAVTAVHLCIYCEQCKRRFFFFENVYCFAVCSTEIHLDTRITKCSQFTILHELCLVLRVIWRGLSC